MLQSNNALSAQAEHPATLTSGRVGAKLVRGRKLAPERFHAHTIRTLSDPCSGLWGKELLQVTFLIRLSV
jgi:hypothetical protein